MILSIISSSECLHRQHRDTYNWPTIPLLSYENSKNNMDHRHNSSHNICIRKATKTFTTSEECIGNCTSLKLPKHSPQLKNVSAVISLSCCLLRITDALVITRASISSGSTCHLPTENLSYSIQLEL
ncbi:hypothetical protein SADUNF_Sadunf01G0049600 [Salix dunnii]|uniref:Uncharacterized protein n=1 Tax=Salix dunnii TaxID=1413687 RepID=A0A835N9M3_9ROSI|nr:hypothetical protein SADUNF_Sadunf01G0049600 [Salix dunnii]